MRRHLLLAGTCCALTALALGLPAHAITVKQKKETCAFGADSQHLLGKDRAKFMTRCMSNKNDPRGVPVGAPATTPPAVPPKS